MLINVEVPETALSVYPDAVVRKALASVTFRPTPIQEQLGMLPFKLGELAGFRVMQVMPTGGVILTDGPTDDINTQPYMIVSVGRGGPAEADDRGSLRATCCRRRRCAISPCSRRSHADRRRAGPRDQGAGQRAGTAIRFAGAMDTVSAAAVFCASSACGRKDDWDALFTRFRAVRDGIECALKRYRAASSGCGLSLAEARRFRRGFDDRHQRRPQHAVADHVAGLDNLRDVARRQIGILHFVHRLMHVRIELLALRREFLHAIFLQHLHQLALGEFDTLDQRLHLGVGCSRSSGPIAPSARCMLSATASTSRAKPAMP